MRCAKDRPRSADQLAIDAYHFYWQIFRLFICPFPKCWLRAIRHPVRAAWRRGDGDGRRREQESTRENGDPVNGKKCRITQHIRLCGSATHSREPDLIQTGPTPAGNEDVKALVRTRRCPDCILRSRQERCGSARCPVVGVGGRLVEEAGPCASEVHHDQVLVEWGAPGMDCSERSCRQLSADWTGFPLMECPLLVDAASADIRSVGLDGTCAVRGGS
jgi:hypothetical protein